MGSETVLDFDRLLAPVSEDQPAGLELKDDAEASALYYRVKDARELARAAERQLVRARYATEDEEITASAPDWKAVRDTALSVLVERSKDLWIAAWLIEALTRLNGFVGLRDGFRLARELCERYWDAIHPRPDEDGIATTVAQLAGLNGEDAEGALIAPINDIPITAMSSEGQFSSADYADALDLEQTSDADRRAQRIEQGAVSMDKFQQAVNASSAEFFQNLLDDIQAAMEEFKALGAVLEEKCRSEADGYSQAPPTSSISNALEECRDRVRSLSRHLLGGDEEGTDESGELVAAGEAGGVAVRRDKVQTREDAFRLLLQVADFFRRTEPHSTVSYQLEQAVRWGRMALPDLFLELIDDRSVREDIFRRAGIPIPSEND